MRILLHCAHVIWSDEFAEWYACAVCGRDAKPAAFETREYKFSCLECRHGRWFGQDKDAAARYHRQHASVSVHYIAHPVKKDRVRRLYGRRVGILIPDIPVIRNPQVRTRIVQDVLPETFDPPY